MHRFQLFVVLLAATVLGSSSAGAAQRSWVLRAGGGGVLRTDDVRLEGGRGGFVALSTSVRPWLALGAEVDHFGFGQRTLGLVFAGGGREASDGSSMTTVAGTVRLVVPAPAGLVPFLTAEGGFGRMQWGDVHAFGGWPPGSIEFPGETQVAWTGTLGAGVQARLPGAWPDLEAGVRSVTWGTRPRQSFLEPRVAIAF